MAPRILVRSARGEDVPRLVELDALTFGSAGVAPFGGDFFLTWLEVNPSGLIVAESDGRVVGYHYAQGADFSFERIGEFTTFDAAADGGFTRATHRPDGNSLHGVSMCSVLPGAGRLLFRRAFAQAERTGKAYYFGFTRMSGLAAFVGKVASAASPQGVGLDGLAMWYARENARMVGGKVWPTAGTPPSLTLPPLTLPDRVLGRQLRIAGYGLARILPGCMPDPESLDFAALLVRCLK